MQEITSRERVGRILRREPVDRVAVTESFWSETTEKWRSEGHLGKDEDINDHFALDMRRTSVFNLTADPDFVDEIIEETEETKTVRSGNGAVLRWWKHRSGTPEHIDFLVHDGESWREHVRENLVSEANYRKRINFEAYRRSRAKCERENLWFDWCGVNVFECIHPVAGHENMLIGMALESDWVKDMCNVYADLLIALMEILFAEEGKPDGIWFWEDMGFKGKPFMSPRMYKEIVWPAHKKTFDYAHSIGCPVIVHSCGFVEPFVPELIKAGMDCLQAMEVKAGMDLVKLKKAYGDRIAFCGGLDIRTLETNDQQVIQAELDKKLPTAVEGGGYILHSDHSIPISVEYETYKFFRDRGLEMGTY